MHNKEAYGFVAGEFKLQPNVRTMLEKVLLSELTSQGQENTTTFFPKNSEIGTDQCAMHHVYNDKTLFLGEIRQSNNIGIRGVGWISTAVGGSY